MSINEELFTRTVEQIERSPQRVKTADSRFSHIILSSGWLVLLMIIFWMVYHHRLERQRLMDQQVLAVVSADGHAATVPIATFRTGPEDVEILNLAGQIVERVQGAGTSDYATRFGYAKEMMTERAAADFAAGLGSESVMDELAQAKREGREFYRKVNVTMRQLTAEDIAGVKFPARLEYQQILPRFDVYVEGVVETYPAGQAQRVDVKRIAYWVRLVELERRTLRYPHALLVEHLQPLRARTTAEVKQGA